MAQHRGHRDGQFGHRPGPHQVTEVDQPVRQAAGAAHHVVVGDVAVDHLHRQIGGDIGDRPPGGRRRGLDRIAAVRVGDVVGEHLHGALRVAQIPLQHPLDSGVGEARQRPAGPARELTESGHPLRAQISVTAERPAAKVGQDAREKSLLPADLGDRAGSGQFDVACSPKAFTGGDERGGGVLGLNLGQAERRVGDLEHSDRLPRVIVQQEVGVLLAAEFGDGGLHAEMLRGDGASLFGVDGRDRQLGRREEVEQGHDR